MLARIHTIIRSDPLWLEVVSTAFMIVWACLLILPYSTFATSRSYAALSQIGNEENWGITAAVLGTIGLAGVLSNKLELRRAGLLGAQFFWATIGICILLANPGSTGGCVYVALALLCMVGYIFGHRGL